MLQWLRRLIRLLLCGEGPVPQLRLRLVAISGRTPHMVHPIITMTDVEQVTLAVSPTDAAGNPIALNVTWESSDPSVELVPSNDTLSCLCKTPLSQGAANVTATAPGHEPEIQPIAYHPAVPGRLNMTVGTPVSDLGS